MGRKQQKSSTCWFSIFVLLSTVTKSQVLMNKHGAGHLEHETDAVMNRQHSAGGPSVHHPCCVPVVVRCHPDSLEVIVQADMFNTGLEVDRRHLRLGLDEHVSDPQSACRAFPSGPTEFTIQADLMDCGTARLPPTEEMIIYSNVLVYSPEPSSDGLLRLDGATIPIECHYNKFYSMYGVSLFPTWVPFIQRATAENELYFTMKLMTGDWQFERGSYTYYVGDPIYFELSSILGNHKPLRVFVDHCVATATPDVEAALRYDFIDHHGCLADAYLTNSSSRFLSRAEDHIIQFQLDAFKFYQEKNNQIYITCQVTAVPSSVSVKSQHRACSLMENRWRSADGNDEDCKSCGVPYPVQESRTKVAPTAHTSVKSEPPLTSLRGVFPNTQPASYLRVRPGAHTTHQSSPGLLMREGNNKKGTLKLGPLVILPSPGLSNNTGQQRGQIRLGLVR